MPITENHCCGCSNCRNSPNHPIFEQHRQINVLMGQLPLAQRRLYAAIESNRIGRGGIRLLSEITGLAGATIARGRAELVAMLAGTPIEKPEETRGRPRIEKTYPDILSVLEGLVADETAGDPTGPRKWVRTSGRKLSKKLADLGYTVNYHKVCDLLNAMGYSMKVNVKKRASTSHSPQRDAQFTHIATQRAAFLGAGNPVISVDAKKKELIGNFRREGRSWCKEAIEVNELNFPSLADHVATSYGVYDTKTNGGFVWVSTAGDSPAFAVAAIKSWWMNAGRHSYLNATALLVLADGGGSNGCRCRAWKQQIQAELCDVLGLAVTVAHYPTGCSKYNPIERRVFSHISINWAGRPLSSLELMLGYIRGTTTETGLTVEAFLMQEKFPQGQKVSKEEMNRLAIEHHKTCPKWNYTIKPRRGAAGHDGGRTRPAAPSRRDVGS